MQVSPSHTSEYLDGNEYVRYGRVLGSGEPVAVWYHDSIEGAEIPRWDMEEAAEYKISISVDTILVADATAHAVWAIDRDAFLDHSAMIGGTLQYVAKADDPFVRHVTDEPSDVLRGELWIESGNEVNEGYHKAKNEA